MPSSARLSQVTLLAAIAIGGMLCFSALRWPAWYTLASTSGLNTSEGSAPSRRKFIAPAVEPKTEVARLSLQCQEAKAYNLLTEDRIAQAQRRVYTPNNIGLQPVTTCRRSMNIKRTFRMRGVTIPPGLCDVTYPGTIPAVLWYGEWSHKRDNCIMYMSKPHGADAAWDWGVTPNAQEAQIVGVWALTHAAVHTATASGHVYNMTHALGLGEKYSVLGPQRSRALERWYAKYAMPGPIVHAPGSIEARLGLTHLWQVNRTKVNAENGGSDFIYVGRALFTLHSPWLHSFQHYTFDGFARMEASLQFLKDNTYVPILCSESSDKVVGLCQRGLETAGIDPSRIIYPVRGDKLPTYIADTVYTAHYVNEGYAVQPHTVSHARGVSFYGSVIPAALRLQPNNAWPPLEERTTVIYAQRSWPRTRSFPPALSTSILNTIRSHLRPDLKLVVLETSHWRTDMETFRHARAMIGPHGGMMANMLFMAPGSHIIEFNEPPTPEYEGKLCFFRLSIAMAHEYYTVQASQWHRTSTRYPNNVSVTDIIDRMRMAGLHA